MKSPQTVFAAGIVFLFCGLAFFTVGLISRQSAFYGVGPAFLTIGIVFIATSRSKRS